MPVSPKEASADNPVYDFRNLFASGGFPEPYLSPTEEGIRRWRQQYVEGILRYDVFTLETISDLNSLRTIFQILQSRVGSPISYHSIAGDVGISSHTVKRYVDILEALYVVFRVAPYSHNIGRALKKEPKIYFYDSGLVEEGGARVENFVAVNLLKQVLYVNDVRGKDRKLYYLRNKEKKEVDFLLADSVGNVDKIIEVKTSDYNLDPNLAYFVLRNGFKGLQLVFREGIERKFENVEVKNVRAYFEEAEI